MGKMKYLSQLIIDENYEQLEIEVGSEFARKLIIAHIKTQKDNINA